MSDKDQRQVERMYDDDTPPPASGRKAAYSWSETRYYVDCPYCGHTQGGEEGDFDATCTCEHCGKEFDVITED